MSAAAAPGPGLRPSLPHVGLPRGPLPSRTSALRLFALAPARAASTLPLRRRSGDLFFFFLNDDSNDSSNILRVFVLRVASAYLAKLHLDLDL